MISYVIAGLGNPGLEYAHTRHNAGFLAIEALAKAWNCSWKRESKFSAEMIKTSYKDKEIILVKPQSYMNLSGIPLQAICSYYKVSADTLIVAYDDIAFDVGELKLSIKGSAGGHNGISSILEQVGQDFIRFRIGIGKKTYPEMDLKDYVLGKWSQEQYTVLQEKIPNLVSALHLILDKGCAYAMNLINQRTKTHDNQKLQS